MLSLMGCSLIVSAAAPSRAVFTWLAGRKEHNITILGYWGIVSVCRDSCQSISWWTETDSQIQRTDLRLQRGSGLGEGWVGEVGIGRGQLLYREWINYMVLPYSTRSYIQHPVINCHGKEYEKEYIYIQLNHFAVEQKSTQRCISI